MVVVTYLLVCLAPVGAFAGMARAFDRFTGATPKRRRQPVVRDERAERDRLGKALQRLSAEHRRVLTTDPPAKAARLRALELAYDDTLREACEVLRIADPPAVVDDLTRLQAEAELCVHGLQW